MKKRNFIAKDLKSKKYKPRIVKQILLKDITINELVDLIQKSKRI